MLFRQMRGVMRYRQRLVIFLSGLITLTVTLLFLTTTVDEEENTRSAESGSFNKDRSQEYDDLLNVYVFEEHHEALSYWFKEADNGRIPKEGNILIHIDAHSDEETPDFESGMPFFRYPLGESEITYMAQKNDVFIQSHQLSPSFYTYAAPYIDHCVEPLAISSRNLEECYKAGQQKRSFAGAVMSGFVSRVIWIRPTWDRDAAASEGPFDVRRIGLGWFPAQLSNGNVQPHFCQCELGPGDDDYLAMSGNQVNTQSGNFSRHCTYLNYGDDSDDDDDSDDHEVKLSPSKCRVMASYRSEHVAADIAIELLTSPGGDGSWIGELSEATGVILDIDEDFFGCEVPSDRIVATDGAERLTWSDLEDLDELVSEFLCPRNAYQEDEADRLLRRLLVTLETACMSSLVERGNRSDASTEDIEEKRMTRCQGSVVEAMSSVDLKNAISSSPSLFCRAGDMASIRRSWMTLALYVVQSLPTNRFRQNVIDGVGFCLNSAPKTLHFGTRPGVGQMNVCHGANPPNSTLVYHYTASSSEELDASIENFDRLLSAIAATGLMSPTRPGVVTLCRSVRDGYTPRHMASKIEEGVLSSLRRQLHNAGQPNMAVIYDQDLLGGKSGWSARAGKSISSFISTKLKSTDLFTNQ